MRETHQFIWITEEDRECYTYISVKLVVNKRVTNYQWYEARSNTEYIAKRKAALNCANRLVRQLGWEVKEGNQQ